MISSSFVALVLPRVPVQHIPLAAAQRGSACHSAFLAYRIVQQKAVGQVGERNAVELARTGSGVGCGKRAMQLRLIRTGRISGVGLLGRTFVTG